MSGAAPDLERRPGTGSSTAASAGSAPSTAPATRQPSASVRSARASAKARMKAEGRDKHAALEEEVKVPEEEAAQPIQPKERLTQL